MSDIRFLFKRKYANSRALVIGIDEYKDAPQLSYAVSDAQAIRDLLTQELDFPEGNVEYLTNTDATKQNILTSFMKFAGDNVDVDDRILVFFAGHGDTKTGKRGEVGYLVPHDAQSSNLSTLIRWSELTGNSELIRAKHMLFVMDACYGGLALTRGIHPGSVRFLRDMLLRYSRQVLTAGKADEVVADSGGPLPNHSVFTGHLIEGIKGAAATEQGVITANGLMAYVYHKVANDKNSDQTPHYGHFDGDGDFIIRAPGLFTDETTTKGIDELLQVPAAEEPQGKESLDSKVRIVKRFLSNDSSTIELHDLMMDEVKQLLSKSGENNFGVQGSFSEQELLERLSTYEGMTLDISVLLACIAYWARPIHQNILQKVIARSADRIQGNSGLTAWLALRWYPLILEMYCSGIAAVAAQRYDSLRNILYTRVSSPEKKSGEAFIAEATADAAIELKRSVAFSHVPGYDRYFTPMSEYLFKLLQPPLDDALFLGKDYENTFDKFEMLLAFVIADIAKQGGNDFWASWSNIGRFGWKHHSRGDSSPLRAIISEAEAQGERWAVLETGLFGGSLKRFLEVAKGVTDTVSRLPWY